MKNILLNIFLVSFFALSCKQLVKNQNQIVENEIDSIQSDSENKTQRPVTTNTGVLSKNDLIGFWVGYFRNAKDEDYDKGVYADETLSWTRENKINISIDEISGNAVKGHSIVAGNNRPFAGTCSEGNNAYSFIVSEPGDNKYDGKFSFSIQKNDSMLTGTWKSYKKIDIQERKYELVKKIFNYNPEQMLERAREYGNWEKRKKVKIEDAEYDEFYDEFSAATNKIYQMNASKNLLTKKDVENLKKGDLLIIRNTIYARHGYSFKNRPLRVFFDAQSWYIPVHTDIVSDLTDIEKKNIELLLKYEKNAKEYYDTFGRG